MELPQNVRKRFQRYGRSGDLERAARMSPSGRRAVARRAASARWIRHRFGARSFEDSGLRGGELVDAGLADLADARTTPQSLAVSLAPHQ